MCVLDDTFTILSGVADESIYIMSYSVAFGNMGGWARLSTVSNLLRSPLHTACHLAHRVHCFLPVLLCVSCILFASCGVCPSVFTAVLAIWFLLAVLVLFLRLRELRLQLEKSMGSNALECEAFATSKNLARDRNVISKKRPKNNEKGLTKI